MNDQMGHGTIKAPSSIDAEADAGILRKAMKGMGKCDSRSSERVGGGGGGVVIMCTNKVVYIAP